MHKQCFNWKALHWQDNNELNLTYKLIINQQLIYLIEANKRPKGSELKIVTW